MKEMKLLVAAISLLLPLYGSMGPVAAAPDALAKAQQMEVHGQYYLAASAYLAMLEGYDFVPGTHSTASLSAEEKVLLGKCAMNCLEQGIKQHLANGESLAECQEYLLLAGAANSMIELEPKNHKWQQLKDYALSHQRKSDILVDAGN